MRRDFVALGGLAVLAATTTGAATYGYQKWVPPGRTLPGMYVGGKLQPAGERLGDWLEARRQAIRDEPAYLDTEGGFIEVTRGELGIEIDVGETMRRVLAERDSGDPARRAYRILKARRGDLDVPLAWRFERSQAEVTLKALSHRVYRAPVDARLDLQAHRRIDDEPGAALDADATLASIERGERDEHPVFAVETRPVPANVTRAMLSDVDVSQVLAAYETDFGGTGEGRATNIATAARYLNETVIAPGQVVSFNDLVGPRELERGFAWAPVIVRDELTPGVGGGTCQVSSTLHAAAVYGLLDVVERRSHSRPSDYAPLGLDATVIYGEVDLKIKNPYDSPLIIHAFLPTASTLRVELLGRGSPGEVVYKYAVNKVEDYYRRVTLKPWMKDRRRKKQRGRKGLDIVSVVKIKQPDGKLRVERQYLSGYKPVPEVFWVGPEHDLHELPELPDGAEHVEYEEIDPTRVPIEDDI